MNVEVKIKSDYMIAAERVFAIEAAGILGLVHRLDDDYNIAVETIIRSLGRVIICGMGKSGIIGKKIAATLASTGTPSFFMHPGEAYHGDLGMVTSEDVFVAISNSGETDEVVKLLPFLKDNGNFLNAITGRPSSTLASAADCHLDVGVEQEACPLQLAPTSSTTATLAMGDALAVTLMDAKGFRPENFARFHPGGSLGRRLLSKVEHEMVCDNLPIVDLGAPAIDVLASITRSKLGIAILKVEKGYGIITDGDIRRSVEEFGDEFLKKTASALMTEAPFSVNVGTRMEDALALMERKSVSSLLVLDENDLVGVIKK